MADLPGYISDTELYYEEDNSQHNLLTGRGHTVTGSDNVIAGADGTVTGDLNALFSLDGAAHTLTDDRTFEVWAENIRLNGTTISSTGIDLDDLTDVTITSPVTGDFLRYNGSVWVNTGAQGATQWAEVAISSSEILNVRATPKTLVAAPGAGKLLEFVSAVLLLDATATAYVETTDNLAIRYTNGTGATVSETIEATGFIDQTADTMTTARPKLDTIVAKTGCENQALVLHNIGDGEYTTGTGVMRVKISYRTWATGW